MRKIIIILLDEVWEHIHFLPYDAYRGTVLQSFQLKIIFRIFPSNVKLFNWSIKENSLCSICNANDIDDTTNYFVQCDNVKPFWREVFHWWYNLAGTIFNVEIYEMLFGVHNFNDDEVLNITLHFVLITAKWFIYQWKRENINMFFLHYLKQTLDIEKYKKFYIYIECR